MRIKEIIDHDALDKVKEEYGIKKVYFLKRYWKSVNKKIYMVSTYPSLYTLFDKARGGSVYILDFNRGFYVN